MALRNLAKRSGEKKQQDIKAFTEIISALNKSQEYSSSQMSLTH